MCTRLKRFRALVMALMTCAALGVALALLPPRAAAIEPVWCDPIQDQACINYCVSQGYGYYCCLDYGTWYVCECFDGPGDCVAP